MEYKSPTKILQQHGVEIDPGDHRSTEQVLAAFVASGRIQIEPVLDEQNLTPDTGDKT